jgi:group I intron endonuclease
MATVYKILSPCLQECYVGSTTRKVEYRWTRHRYAKDCRSSVLFEKHGVDNCKFVVLEICPLEERREKEQWWLEHSVGAVNKYSVIQNEEHRKIYCKEWSEANRESRNASNKKWREANKEKKKALNKIWNDKRKKNLE